MLSLTPRPSAPLALLLLSSIAFAFHREATGELVAIALIAFSSLWLAPVIARGFRAPAGRPPWSAAEVGWVALIVAVAAGLRCWELGRYPFWMDYDSVQNGWIGTQLLHEWETRWHVEAVLKRWASGNESAYMYLLGLSLKYGGHSLTSLRLPAAIGGTLTILAIYVLARELFGRGAAAAGAALAAIAPWHIHISRMGKQPILVPLFGALALWALAVALRQQARRPRLAWLAGCGVALGLGLNFYEASRALPLAIAMALLLARGSEGRLRAGLLELGWVAGVSAVVASPLLIEAALDPHNFMGHISNNHVLGDGVGALAENTRRSLTHMLFYLPRSYVGSESIPSPFAILPALIVWGGVGLMLSALQCGDASEARGRARLGLLLFASLTLALLPTFTLPRYHLLAPRRYGGMLIVLYGLAGGAVAALLRDLLERGGRALAAGAAVLVAGLLALELPVMFDALSIEPTWLRGRPAAIRQQLTARWALERAGEGQRVALAASHDDGSYLMRFIARHPRIEALPTAWPLPRSRIDGDVLLVSEDRGLTPALQRLFRAREEPATLRDASGRALTEPLRVVRLLERALRERRLDAEAPQDQRLDAWLLVDRPGRYRFRWEGAGALSIDGRELEGSGPRSIVLGYGLYRLRYRGGSPLQWERPPERYIEESQDRWQPIDRRRLWRLPDGALPRGPRVVDLGAAFVERVRVEVGGDREFNRILQDMALSPGPPGPDSLVPGELLLADVDTDPIKRWPGDQPLALRDAEGRPFQLPDRYHQSQPGQLALDVEGDEIWLLETATTTTRARLRRFVAGRERPAPTGPPLVTPVDLALSGDWCAVADVGARALVFLPRADAPAPAPRRGLTPVAVAVGGGRLAYIDKDTQQLHVRAIRAGGELGGAMLAVTLPRVGPTMRLSLDARGRCWVIDAARHQGWLFSARGELLALRGDPEFLTAVLASGPKEDDDGSILPVAALSLPLSEARGPRGRLALIGVRQLALFDEHTSPDLRPGLTLGPAKRRAPGQPRLLPGPHTNVSWDPDKGFFFPNDEQLPSQASWELEVTPDQAGRYVAWALYATAQRRPFELLLDGHAISRDHAMRTGGFAPRYLRWQRLTELDLTAGSHRLTLRMQGRTVEDGALLPHLARLRLVRR